MILSTDFLVYLTSFSSSGICLNSLLNFSLVFLYADDSVSSTLMSCCAFPCSAATRLSILTRTYSVISLESSKEESVGSISDSSQRQSCSASWVKMGQIRIKVS